MRTEHVSEPGLSIRCLSDGHRPVVAVAGEIDLSTAEQFRVTLDGVLDGHDRVEIDLRDTTFMDSTGLAVLVAVHRRLGQVREAVVLRHPSPTIVKLLEVSGVGRLVDVRTDGREPAEER